MDLVEKLVSEDDSIKANLVRTEILQPQRIDLFGRSSTSFCQPCAQGTGLSHFLG